jgi:hypothetical protein
MTSSKLFSGLGRFRKPVFRARWVANGSSVVGIRPSAAASVSVEGGLSFGTAVGIPSEWEREEAAMKSRGEEELGTTSFSRNPQLFSNHGSAYIDTRRRK